MVTAELPRDVIESILLWLPATSLIRFKCVDKSWCAMIGKPYFKEQHRTRSALRPDATHLLLTTYEQASLAASPDGGATSDHTLPNILEHGPFHLSCCHGLIAMHPRCQAKAKGNTFVYNPNTRETLSIPFNANAFKDCTSVRSFIGFEPVSNQYKLMMFGTFDRGNARHCKIVTLGETETNWRQVVINDNDDSELLDLALGLVIWDIDSTCLVNGALHWMTPCCILVFDFESEKFRTMTTPPELQDLIGHLKLYQVGGRLTLVESRSNAPVKFRIWTLKDYYNGVWVKERFDFSAPRDLLPTEYNFCSLLHVVGGMNNGEILISVGPDHVFGYDLVTRKSRKINVRVGHDGKSLRVMPYTDSMRCY